MPSMPVEDERRQKNRRAQSSRYHLALQIGLCPICMKRKAMKDAVRCSACAKKLRRHNQAWSREQRRISSEAGNCTTRVVGAVTSTHWPTAKLKSANSKPARPRGPRPYRIAPKTLAQPKVARWFSNSRSSCPWPLRTHSGRLARRIHHDRRGSKTPFTRAVGQIRDPHVLTNP